MKLWGISQDDLWQIVRQVSDESYGGNIRCGEGLQGTWRTDGVRVKTVTFGLRVNSSSGPGHRVSASAFGPRRRMVAACWHAHRDVMHALFIHNPDARIKSAMADYRGLADFLETFPDTGRTNIGSLAYPVLAREACDCAADFQPPVFDPVTAWGTVFAR